MKRSEKIAMLQIRFVIIFSDFISFHFFFFLFFIFLSPNAWAKENEFLKINCNLQHRYCCDRIIKTLRMIQGRKKNRTKNIQIIS